MANERSYGSLLDKSGWGDGPWLAEPDKVVWVDDASGLDCMIVRNRVGGLCGYVGVPQGHPWFEADYDKPAVDVHGGLTFADHCAPGKSEDEHAICHNDEGRPPNVWWFGFDCVHLWDLVPSFVGAHAADDVYRDLGYVRAEVASLAGQLAKASSD